MWVCIEVYPYYYPLSSTTCPLSLSVSLDKCYPPSEVLSFMSRCSHPISPVHPDFHFRPPRTPPPYVFTKYLPCGLWGTEVGAPSQASSIHAMLPRLAAGALKCPAGRHVPTLTSGAILCTLQCVWTICVHHRLAPFF